MSFNRFITDWVSLVIKINNRIERNPGNIVDIHKLDISGPGQGKVRCCRISFSAMLRISDKLFPLLRFFKSPLD